VISALNTSRDYRYAESTEICRDRTEDFKSDRDYDYVLEWRGVGKHHVKRQLITTTKFFRPNNPIQCSLVSEACRPLRRFYLDLCEVRRRYTVLLTRE